MTECFLITDLAILSPSLVSVILIPLPMIPLLLYTSRRAVMGEFVNRWSTTLMGIVSAAIIISLNAFLLYSLFLLAG